MARNDYPDAPFGYGASAAKLTAAETAKLIGINPETLRRWVREGRAPRATRINDRGDLRFTRADVEAFLADRAVEPEAAIA